MWRKEMIKKKIQISKNTLILCDTQANSAKQLLVDAGTGGPTNLFKVLVLFNGPSKGSSPSGEQATT